MLKYDTCSRFSEQMHSITPIRKLIALQTHFKMLLGLRLLLNARDEGRLTMDERGDYIVFLHNINATEFDLDWTRAHFASTGTYSTLVVHNVGIPRTL